jgi:hypothetical protein
VERGINGFPELSMDDLDAFRAGRGLKPATAPKELQLLRQFCSLCLGRRWTAENAAKRIKPRRNLKPNDVEPFSLAEVQRMQAGDLPEPRPYTDTVPSYRRSSRPFRLSCA